MAASHVDAEHMRCAVCTEVYTSPRFLSCHHTFCLKCLEDLANIHGDVIPCPTCRASTNVPTGGVAGLQVNFYFTDDMLQRARNAADPRLCPVHPNEHVDLHCTQCDQVICLRCKVTRHEGHAAEELSAVAARYKEAITEFHSNLDGTVGRVTRKLQTCQNNEQRAREKGTAVEEQIQARHDAVVAMAGRYRDEALQELQAVSDSVMTLLAADTRRVQDELNSLLQLQVRVQQALSAACDTDIWQVGKEMTKGRGNEWLREFEARLPDTTYRPGLHGYFTNEVQEAIRRYIGSPVKLDFSSVEEMEVVRVGRCGDGECCEVHAVRETEDQTVQAAYGGPGGDFSKETGVSFLPDGSKNKSAKPYGVRVSYVTRKGYHWAWSTQENRNIGSKGDSMFSILQDCTTGTCSVKRMSIQFEDGKETCTSGSVLIQPKVSIVHNFDSNNIGSLFAVIDEAKESIDELRNNDQMQMVKSSFRVVHLYCTTSDSPVATYTPPKQPFFPTDICFCRDDLLLIADWMNDSVHMVEVAENKMAFINCLPGSGDIVRPTALNLDLNGRLLIGCGDGWVLKFSVAEYTSFNRFSELRLAEIAKIAALAWRYVSRTFSEVPYS